ncbi:MAG: mechanosensitive ion channel family protein [Bradymonadaceae bacterium]
MFPIISHAITSAIVPVLAQTPEPKKMVEIARDLELFNVTKLLVAALIVIAGFVTSRLVRETLDKLSEGNAKRRLTTKKLTSFLRVGIFVLTSYLVIMTFFDAQEDKTALIGLGGTLAVAFGFAMKDISSSVVAGILILIDQPFQVGDRVKFGDTYGEVVEIGLRAVRIETLDDDEVSIPNNKFLTESVSSANAGELDMMVPMDFHISMTEDFELAKEIIYEACTTSKYVYLEKPVVVRVQEEAKSVAFSTTLTCKAYVIDSRYEMDFVTDVTERVKRAFRKHRLKHPYMREYAVGGNREPEYAEAERRRHKNDRQSTGRLPPRN